MNNLIGMGHNQGPPLADLSDPLVRNRLAVQMQADVDAACQAEFAEDPRTHLGASIIGHDCAAYAWNTFRWLKFEQFSGQMLRLFNRGHEEEARIIRWLTIMGFQVRDVDPDTKKQFRIGGAKGHFGGSLDGMAKAPARYNLPPDLVLLLEFKTHNKKSFDKLKKDGVCKSKPMHFKQMCSYGRAWGFQYALYCAVHKDTDALYFEIVKLDYGQADDLFRKAESIIFSPTQPAKIAQIETYFECKWCDFAGICHRGEMPVKNCRSCRRAHPVENGEWFCDFHNGIIPKDVIPNGCNDWARIK